MAIIIADECINCGDCELECQNTAIYKAAEEWKFEESTELTGHLIEKNSSIPNPRDASGFPLKVSFP